MPRVKLAGDSYKDKDLTELVYIYKRRAGMTVPKLCEMLEISETTYHRWMKKPGNIPLTQLRTLQRKLNIPMEAMVKCLF